MNSLPSRTKALIDVSFREFARYALPSIIGMLIVGLQTIIDGLFVGRGVGALGLAAVNIAMNNWVVLDYQKCTEMY
jgi:Na+-driven multidrug efflux pump